MTENTLKILYLVTKSNYGGCQKYVLDLATAAEASGYDVLVAHGGTGDAGAKAGILHTKLHKANLRTYHVKNFMRNMSLFRDIKAFFEVVKLLKQEKPDVLHVNSSKAGGIGALAGRLSGVKKIVFTSHGLTIDETWRPAWQQAMIYVATWLTFALSHEIIMISNATYERAQKMALMKAKINLIKNGIAPYKILDKEEARQTLAPDAPKNKFWIGGIGELHPNKNWSAMIRTMIDLPSECHLFIIGEGEERNKLEELISNLNLYQRVHLLGFVEGAPYLKALDVYVLPSLKEGLPYVLLEAGLAQLPVVASDLPGIRDIIDTGEDGLLVEPTETLLATTINMLMRDEAMRNRLGQSLQQKVFDEFSIDTMAEKTFTLYVSSRSEDS